ncbi:MAG: Flp pilus assembly protein CpaB [Acidimicrobiia bacterium]
MFRRSPRALAFWAAALVVAIVTATVVASDLAAIHRRAAGLGPIESVVVARRDLAVGRRLTADDTGLRDVHRSQLPAGAIVGRDRAHGRVVAVAVLRGGFVVERNLAPRTRTGLDGIVPEGMRAIRVDVDGALVPRVGAAVDVLASYQGSAERAGDTEVVASGALVLAVDHRGAGSAGRSGDGVTLLVDAASARDLADAQANGVLTLALVPPEDAARS